jgi:hypothetical protein
MCMKIIGAPSCAAVEIMSGSWVPPETSLMISAPHSMASLATRALRVSTDMGHFIPVDRKALNERNATSTKQSRSLSCQPI